jgi:hypothetical protein
MWPRGVARAGWHWVGGDDVGSGAGISMVRQRRAVRTNFLIDQLVDDFDLAAETPMFHPMPRDAAFRAA